MVAPALDAAFSYLHAGGGPFVFNLPYNVQPTELSDDWSYGPPPSPTTSQPDEVAVERAADLLVAAERPAILAGYGANAAIGQ